MVDHNADLLGVLVGNPNNDVPVGIKRYRMSDGSTEKFDSDLIVFIVGVNPHNQIITLLLIRITREVGITGHVFQRTVKLAVFTGYAAVGDRNSGLESTYTLPENCRFTIFRADSEAY